MRAPTVDRGGVWIIAIFAWMAVVVWLLVENGKRYGTLDPVTVTATCEGGDSVTVYPERLSVVPGDTLQLTGICWENDLIIGCSGACDTIPPHLWKPETDGAGTTVQM